MFWYSNSAACVGCDNESLSRHMQQRCRHHCSVQQLIWLSLHALSRVSLTSSKCIFLRPSSSSLSQQKGFAMNDVSHKTQTALLKLISYCYQSSVCKNSMANVSASLRLCRSVRAHSGPAFKGVCKRFSRSQGHGFICPSHGGDDIFVHISEWVTLTLNMRRQELF